MSKLNKISNIVLQVLEEHEDARNDDFVLIDYVYSELDIKCWSLDTIALWHKEYDLPSFESITRCRRKIQHDHPELANAKIVAIRNAEQEEYKEFARG